MKTILITGGAGFIGGNLIHHLLDNNKLINIINIDNLFPLYDIKIETVREHIKKGGGRYQHLSLNITDLPSLFRHLRSKKIDMIIHLAAKAGIRDSFDHASEYIKTNVYGTQNVLYLAKFLKIKKMIFASSSSVYGNNSNTPFDESNLALNPISPYAATKLITEKLCHIYSILYEMNIIALRFFTVYGPNQRPDLAIHKFFKNIFAQQPIPFFGDGSTSRDYTYIDDLISGIVKAMDYECQGFDVFNLGNGIAVSLTELVLAIKEVCGKEIILNKLPQQAGDVNHTYASIKKAKQKLGFSPSTSLIEGLKNFNIWFEAKEGKCRLPKTN